MAPNVEMRCIVVTPERTVRDEPAEFVALPLFDGEIGIAPTHSPMIGRLGVGEMRITQEGQTARFYIEGGFAEVVDNMVTVLTNRAVPASDLDHFAATERLHTALDRPAHSAESMQLRDRSVEQARAELRVIRRSS